MLLENDFLTSSITYISTNKDWLFSGVGLAVLIWIYNFIFKKKNSDDEPDTPPISKRLPDLDEELRKATEQSPSINNVEDTGEKFCKNNTYILIVDDEIKFKLPKILKGAGWIHSKLVRDIDNLDHPDVKEADILFVDVQGVGIALGFKDEGLGLVEALKEKYPAKKVIIYSVVSEGNRFHNAFNVCDAALSKDADPYQFQRMVERFALIGGHE